MICTERAFRNLTHQGWSREDGSSSIEKIGTVEGQTLLGLRVKAPLSVYKDVRVLPMKSIKPDKVRGVMQRIHSPDHLEQKGTGIVTSVPSESPDDYINLMDLKKKPAFYGIQEAWVHDVEPVSVVETPSYGTMTAPTLCEELQIKSPNDTAKLEHAKLKAYRDGYYQGKMAVGDLKGMPVEEAKPLIRETLIQQQDAFPYWEPEKPVVSRTGNDCVVALVDQWYLDYGEPKWKEQAIK